MSKEPNKSNEPNNEARVLSDEELEGIVGGATDSGPVSSEIEPPRYQSIVLKEKNE